MALPPIINPQASEWEKIGWHLPRNGYTCATLRGHKIQHLIVKDDTGRVKLYATKNAKEQPSLLEGLVSANTLFQSMRERAYWLKNRTCALSIIQPDGSTPPLYCITVRKRKNKIYEIYRRELPVAYQVILLLLDRFKIRNAGTYMAQKILTRLRINPKKLPIGKALRLIHKPSPREPEFHVVAWKRPDGRLQMDARPGFENSNFCLQPIMRPPANYPSLNPNKLIPPHIPFRALPVLKM